MSPAGCLELTRETDQAASSMVLASGRSKESGVDRLHRTFNIGESTLQSRLAEDALANVAEGSQKSEVTQCERLLKHLKYNFVSAYTHHCQCKSNPRFAQAFLEQPPFSRNTAGPKTTG